MLFFSCLSKIANFWDYRKHLIFSSEINLNWLKIAIVIRLYRSFIRLASI